MVDKIDKSAENDAEMNHEKVVDDFFSSLEASEAPESDPEAPVAEESHEDPTAAVSTDESHSEGAEDEDEDSEDDSEEEIEPEATADDVPDKWEERFRHQQSLHDRQMNELRAQLDQMNHWAQGVYQQQLAQHQAAQQAQAAPQHVVITDQQIVQAVETDVERAFVFAATQRPDLMPKVITAARRNEKLGDAVADEMQYEFTQHQLKQQQEQFAAQQAALQQNLEERDAPAQIQQTMTELVQSVAQQYGDSFTAVQDEFLARAQETAPQFKQYMEANGQEMTPDAVRHFLVQTFLDLREQKLNEQSSKPRKARKLSAKEQVEASTSSDGSRPEDMSADDLAISELLKGAAELQIDMTTPNR